MQLNSAAYLAASTDGWKKKFMEGGTPLVNVCLLLPDGGSVFHKAATVGGVSKDAKWIFEFHKELVEELVSMQNC